MNAQTFYFINDLNNPLTAQNSFKTKNSKKDLQDPIQENDTNKIITTIPNNKLDSKVKKNLKKYNEK